MSDLQERIEEAPDSLSKRKEQALDDHWQARLSRAIHG